MFIFHCYSYIFWKQKHCSCSWNFSLNKLNFLNFHRPLINKLRNDTKGEQKKILLEGPRLVLEAIRAGVRLSTVFFSDRKQLNASKVYEGEVSRLFKVSPKQMKMFSATCHPPGIIGS